MKRNKSFVDSKPLLYLVATPIGNLKEFSPRAIEVISNADFVAAEDTRNTSLLLSHFNIHKPLISLHEHNEAHGSDLIVSKIKEGKKVVYLSDAGYPGISDPGNILVRKCLDNDISISTISGSSAFINALVASGLDSSHFYFYGFLSSKDSEAIQALNNLKPIKNTLIFYEAPHRIMRTLELLLNVLGNREAVLARELTKLNEEFIMGTLDELVNLDEKTLIGEMVLIVSGNKYTSSIDENLIKQHLEYLLSKGLTKKDAVEVVATLLNINKNTVYNFIKQR